jgi:hypothetical protein
MNKNTWGWLSISVALLLSVYANANCSFGCVGIWGQLYNPLAVIGLVLYAVGTYLIFKK